MQLVAAIFVLALRSGMPEQEVRALTFFSLVVMIVSLILVNRSFSASLLTALRRPNRTLAAVLAAVAAILALTLLWPSASKLFAFGPLHADDLALTLGAGIIVLISLELSSRCCVRGCSPRPGKSGPAFASCDGSNAACPRDARLRLRKRRDAWHSRTFC